MSLPDHKKLLIILFSQTTAHSLGLREEVTAHLQLGAQRKYWDVNSLMPIRGPLGFISSYDYSSCMYKLWMCRTNSATFCHFANCRCAILPADIDPKQFCPLHYYLLSLESCETNDA